MLPPRLQGIKLMPLWLQFEIEPRDYVAEFAQVSDIRSRSQLSVCRFDAEATLRDGLLDPPIKGVELPEDILLAMFEIG
jgi:hypothetical protein